MANAGFRQLNGQRAQINGLDAYVGTYQGNSKGSATSVTVGRAHRPRAERVPARRLAPPNQFESAQREFAASIRSFRR